MNQLRKGHRERMMQKLLANPDALSLTDLIEMTLFLSIPLKDTKDIALELKKHFGSMQAILSAPPEKLQAIKGVGERSVFLFKFIQRLVLEILKEKIEQKDLIKNFNDLVKYFQFELGEKSYEECKILFLNSKNFLIKQEVLNKGSLNNVAICPREILRRCLEVPCASIIMIHNHPSQEPSPSREDIEITKQISFLLKNINIGLVDHIIVGTKEFFSFRQNNLLF